MLKGEPVITVANRIYMNNGENNPTKANTNRPFLYVLETVNPQNIEGIRSLIKLKGIIQPNTIKIK